LQLASVTRERSERKRYAHHPSYQQVQAITFEPEPLQNQALSYIEKLETTEAQA